MNREIVIKTIDEVAGGNNNLRIVMDTVCLCGKDIIDAWPEENTEMLKRRSLRATSRLIHQKIISDEILSQRDSYWETENGKKVNEALTKFVETRKKS